MRLYLIKTDNITTKVTIGDSDQNVEVLDFLITMLMWPMVVFAAVVLIWKFRKSDKTIDEFFEDLDKEDQNED